MRRRPLLVLAFVAVTGAVLLAREDITITPISTKDGVRASFTARDAWTQGTREMLQNGTQLMFEFDIELRRPAPLWFFDRVLARVRIASMGKFDTLTGGYQVQRMRDGRVVDAKTRDKETEVRDWLTQIDQVALDPVPALEPNVDYYVHVSLTIRPRRIVSVWSILPLGRPDDSGRGVFTHLR